VANSTFHDLGQHHCKAHPVPSGNQPNLHAAYFRHTRGSGLQLVSPFEGHFYFQRRRLKSANICADLIRREVVILEECRRARRCEIHPHLKTFSECFAQRGS